MKLNRQDLWLLKGWAREQFERKSGYERLGDEALTHGDKLAVAYFEAAIRLLVKKDLLKVEIDLSFDTVVPDSDPEVEFSDWMMQEDEEP